MSISLETSENAQVGLTSFHDLTTLLPLELWSQDFKDKGTVSIELTVGPYSEAALQRRACAISSLISDGLNKRFHGELSIFFIMRAFEFFTSNLPTYADLDFLDSFTLLDCSFYVI